jgi:hypothetical protein
MKFVSVCSGGSIPVSNSGTKGPHDDRQGHQMLLIAAALVTLGWLAILAAVAGLCLNAARGDRASAARAGRAPAEPLRLVA